MRTLHMLARTMSQHRSVIDIKVFIVLYNYSHTEQYNLGYNWTRIHVITYTNHYNYILDIIYQESIIIMK